MVQQSFGGRHTERKLQTISKYLNAYTTALKNQPFQTIYFDAFAGTGDITFRDIIQPCFSELDKYKPIIKGSAKRALELKTPFSKYIFSEKSSLKINELKHLQDKYSDLSDRMVFVSGDANDILVEFCNKTNWRNSRSVVFLDPFGNQVRWSTIEILAETKAIDLWYLFPAGLGVDRQISQNGNVEPEHATSLDKLFGTENWRSAFIETKEQEDLFGDVNEVKSKQANANNITKFMIDRMKVVFEGGVLDTWLPLGSRGVHMYSLIFAWANPSPKAKLASKLAKAVMK